MAPASAKAILRTRMKNERRNGDLRPSHHERIVADGAGPGSFRWTVLWSFVLDAPDGKAELDCDSVTVEWSGDPGTGQSAGAARRPSAQSWMFRRSR